MLDDAVILLEKVPANKPTHLVCTVAGKLNAERSATSGGVQV